VEVLMDWYFWLALRLPRSVVLCCIVRAWLEARSRGLCMESITVKALIEDWKEGEHGDGRT
jgi:hypothetical protein